MRPAPYQRNTGPVDTQPDNPVDCGREITSDEDHARDRGG